MDNPALVGKKLLVSLENRSDFEKIRLFPLLQESLPPARVITTYGKKDTLYAASTEKPDAVLFHYDSDPSFGGIIDMQWQIHEIDNLNCKLMLYSKWNDTDSPYSVRNLIEAFSRVAFLDAKLTHDEVAYRVCRCLQAKGVKVVIAADYHGSYFQIMRLGLNTWYPGNHIVYADSVDSVAGEELGESDFVIVGFAELERTLEFLNALKIKKTKAMVIVPSYHQQVKDECAASGINAHYFLGTCGTRGGDIMRFLKPYIGNFVFTDE